MADEIMAQGSAQLTSINPAGAAVALRSAKEVEAMVLMAKRYPRDEQASEARIIRACKRERLAEVLAQNWGNIDFGWTELARESLPDGTEVSHCEAWAWDIEVNTRRSIRFDVPLIRDTRQGQHILTDERDKYELCANYSGRRMRACILNIIPGDITEAALEECTTTLKKSAIPLEKRRENAIKAFDKIGVKQPMLEKYLGCRQAAWTANDMFRLTKVLNSINDGMTTPGEHFPELAAKPLSGEQQAEILKKYGADKVQQALKLGGYATLNEVTTETVGDLKNVLDGLK